MKTNKPTKRRPTPELRKKANRIRALVLMNRIDARRSDIDYYASHLAHFTGLHGQALAHYCESQGYGLISHVIFDSPTNAFCKGSERFYEV